MTKYRFVWLLAAAFSLVSQSGSIAGELVIGRAGPVPEIVVAPAAGPWERNAGADLRKYIGLMTGIYLEVVAESSRRAPAIFIGQAALRAEPSLQLALDRVVKKDPTYRADAIAIRSVDERLFLAGANDESHYFAVSWLLQHWGCRWYMPTAFGEVVPEKSELRLGDMDLAYAPPFEIRHYSLAWLADASGAEEFRRRNFMSGTTALVMGHGLGKYTKELVAVGGTALSVSLSDPKTAEHVAAKIERDYALNKNISLAIEDGIHIGSGDDKVLESEYDRYALAPSATDALMTLYNNVGRLLRARHPKSSGKIGGLAYSNVTLPPRLVTEIEPNVVMWLAPIDIDPNHGMDDPRSPPRQEYRSIMYQWARLLRGRLAIYDYDQGMLVWRDLPNPSHHAFAQDVQHYARAGILGIGTESRGATATTFLNLFFRGQLMWDPNANIDALLAEFYEKFFGPAAEHAASYWNVIFAAWKNTSVTEHEYMAAPAIYTPKLIATLQESLEKAETVIGPLWEKTTKTRNERLYLERMRFMRLSFEVLQNYMGSVAKAARDNAYSEAAKLGDRALQARDALTEMNPTFTTYRRMGEKGPMWFPGEVAQVRGLAALTDGSSGHIVSQLPLQWNFRHTAPLPVGWQYAGPEGGIPSDASFSTQKPTEANGWKPVRTDLYLQAQGIVNQHGQSHLGHYWYQVTLNMHPAELHGDLHLMFPGLFNECWLYVNGELVANRQKYREPWWVNDYTFEWDVALSGKLRQGENTIALRGFNPHHFGGLFRRPFLYRAGSRPSRTDRQPY